jgi:hypothetical protein
VFLLVVVLGHAVLILYLAGRGSASRGVPEAEITVSPILLLPTTQPDRESAQALRPAAPVRGQLPARRDNAVIAAPPPALESAPIATPAPGTTQDAHGAPVDWIGLAQESVPQWGLSTPKHLEFGAIPKEETASQEEPVEFFRKSREGEIQMIAPGIERRWTSDRCYVEFGHPPDLFFSLAPKVIMSQCLGPRLTRDDLFDHLKPEYLKPKE